MILASDFDRTLFFFNENEQYKPQDLKAIQTFQKLGHQFGICTGRDLASTLEPVKDVLEPDFYIVCSGAAIFDKQLNKVYEKCIPNEVARKLYDNYKSIAKIYIRTEDNVYITKAENPFTQPKDTIYISDFPNVNIESVSIGFSNKEKARHLTKEINTNFKSDLIAYQNVNFVDIAPSGCSKGIALQKYADIIQSDIAAGIGDYINDIPLLEKSDISFTFNSSPDIVKENANYLVDDIDQAIQILIKNKE